MPNLSLLKKSCRTILPIAGIIRDFIFVPSTKMNVIVRLEFELTYYNVAVQHVSHNTTGIIPPPTIIWNEQFHFPHLSPCRIAAYLLTYQLLSLLLRVSVNWVLSFGWATSQGEGKLWVEASSILLSKMTLGHIPSMAEGLGKYILQRLK